MDIENLRQDYSYIPLTEGALPDSPFPIVENWISEALQHRDIPEANAMSLATVSPEGIPTSRMVLLKQITPEGFIFYTNYDSLKAHEIAENPHVCLHFYWAPLYKQISIQGTAKKIPEDDSRRYFQSRPRESQLAAWASHQSSPAPSREAIEKAFKELEEHFKGQAALPLPPHWGGYLVEPTAMRIWQGGRHRMHDSFLYTQNADKTWKRERLWP